MSSSYYTDFWLLQYNEQQQAKGLFTFPPKCGTLFFKYKYIRVSSEQTFTFEFTEQRLE